VPQQLEIGVVEQVGDVVFGAGEEVVDTDDVVAVGEEALAEVAAEEAGAAGDEDAFSQGVGHGGHSVLLAAGVIAQPGPRGCRAWGLIVVPAAGVPGARGAPYAFVGRNDDRDYGRP